MGGGRGVKRRKREEKREKGVQYFGGKYNFRKKGTRIGFLEKIYTPVM